MDSDTPRKGEKRAPYPILVLLLSVLSFNVNYDFKKVSESGIVGFIHC